MVSKPAVRKAINAYRKQFPENEYPGPGRKSWLEHKKYTKALDYDGVLYPPKKIWSLITTVDTPNFNTSESVKGLTDLGFVIVPKPTDQR